MERLNRRLQDIDQHHTYIHVSNINQELTLDYLNSDKCLIKVNTLEDAQYLASIGIECPASLTKLDSFTNEVEHWGTPIYIEDNNSWGNLEAHSRNNKTIVTIEQIKDSFKKSQPIKQEIWKNPKPTKKNTQEVPPESYYVKDGLSIPQYTELGITGTNLVLNDFYPIHKLQPDQPVRIGDIIQFGDNWSVIKSKEDKSKLYDSVWRITDENNKAIQVFELREYACGTLFDVETQQILKEVPKGAKIKSHHKDPLPFEHHEISREFNVNLDKLKSQHELMHKQLNTILDHPLNVARKEWAYIWGPSGSGKSTLAIDYAESSKKPYILQQGTAQLTVDDLLGYKSITTGEYFPSLLRDAVENGKVFILDEADACNGNTLLCLNALKNKTFQFPDKEILIHPDFRLIMTANTFNDYSEVYNSRNPLDKATLDRCSVLHYDMRDYHLALRYGLKYIKQIADIDTKSPRQIEREVIEMQIEE